MKMLSLARSIFYPCCRLSPLSACQSLWCCCSIWIAHTEKRTWCHNLSCSHYAAVGSTAVICSNNCDNRRFIYCQSLSNSFFLYNLEQYSCTQSRWADVISNKYLQGETHSNFSISLFSHLQLLCSQHKWWIGYHTNLTFQSCST